MREGKSFIPERAKKILKRGVALIGGLATTATLHGEMRNQSELSVPVAVQPEAARVQAEPMEDEHAPVNKPLAPVRIELRREAPRGEDEILEEDAYKILDTADPFAPDYPFDKDREQYLSDERARKMGFVIDDGLIYRHWDDVWVACKGGVCERSKDGKDFLEETATEEQHIKLLQTFIDQLPGATIERVNPWRYACKVENFVSYIQAESDGSFTIDPRIYDGMEPINVDSLSDIPQVVRQFKARYDDILQKEAFAQNE